MQMCLTRQGDAQARKGYEECEKNSSKSFCLPRRAIRPNETKLSDRWRERALLSLHPSAVQIVEALSRMKAPIMCRSRVGIRKPVNSIDLIRVSMLQTMPRIGI